MEKWLYWRGLRLVPAEFVSIEGYAPPALPPTHVLPPGLYDLDVDKNVPHLLERRFNNTVNVRVAQKDNGKQLFIIVRNLTQVKFAKKDLFTLCKDFVQFADTIFFSSRLPPQSNQTCLAQAAQYRRSTGGGIYQPYHLPLGQNVRSMAIATADGQFRTRA